MQGEKGERWRKLCEQAASEQDPQKLMELAREIDRLLEEKERRLKEQRTNSVSEAPD
jgi:predicted Zn-dependent protease